MRFVLLLLLAARPAQAQARFDPPFFFGLATAPGQAEDHLEDVWLDWGRRGRVAGFYSVAEPERRLDFWTHPEIEVDLAARTGVQVFRLGVDWGRVEPRPHEFDAQAIARYRRLMGLIRRRKMRVMLTLMHHSIPLWAQARGGWLNDGMKEDYLEFSRRMIREFAPGVDYWITFNEANVFAPLAYADGLWPPGEKRSLLSLVAFRYWRGETVRAIDRMADAHAALYGWAHARYPHIKLGFAQNMAFYTSRTALGRLAARATAALMNWRFPEQIRGHTDFFGMNYYGAEWIKNGRLDLDPGEEYSESGRAIFPQGLEALLNEAHHRFPDLPIIITENGIADPTDILRPAYLLEHLSAVARARAEGVPIVGYVFWTLSDNMEWSDGYCPKFGLVAVDRAHDLRRIPRGSYSLYQKIVATRKITAAMRQNAWSAVAAAAGKTRPFCRAADAVTALPEPQSRPFSSKDWEFH